MSDPTSGEPPFGGTPPPPPPGGAVPPPPPAQGGGAPPPPPGGFEPAPATPPPAPGGMTPPPPAQGMSTPPPPGGMAGGLPPQGGQGFPAAPPQQGYAVSQTMAGGAPAEWGQRAIAWLIDVFIFVPVYIVGAILTGITGLNIFIYLVYLAGFAFGIYNIIFLQGTTGQTIGKGQQGIKLINDASGQPVGTGMAVVRWLVASAISMFTCGIGGLLDLLWPLWDGEKKRLTDKALKNSVIVGGPKEFKIPFIS